MKISEVIKILMAEKIFRRTPKGRILTDFAVENIIAALEDEKNYDQQAIQCLNCGLITSILLVPEGCHQCGSRDLNTDFIQQDIIGEKHE
jgi:hypothetical protein